MYVRTDNRNGLRRPSVFNPSKCLYNNRLKRLDVTYFVVVWGHVLQDGSLIGLLWGRESFSSSVLYMLD